MPFINEEDLIGQAIILLTQNVTGHEFFSYLLIFIVFVLLALLFRLPLELTLAYTLPLALILAVGFASFIPILSFIALLTAFIIAKKFIAN